MVSGSGGGPGTPPWPPLQRDPRPSLARLREARPATDEPPYLHAAPPMLVDEHIPDAGKTIGRLRPTVHQLYELPEFSRACPKSAAP